MKSEVKYQDVTLEEINVIKRDGRSVKFNSEKIFDALTKACAHPIDYFTTLYTTPLAVAITIGARSLNIVNKIQQINLN